jgi:uncharacterized protein involved in outer membrane biogenesis
MRLIISAVSIVALLIVAALVGPSFVDWNKYKPQIISQVKKATGLDVTVGEISMAVLPAPHAKISDVVVTSPRKVKFDNLLTMKSAEVSVELIPLLSKKINVNQVTLIDPVINAEIMEDGSGSWMTDELSGKNKDAAAEVAGEEKSASKAAEAISFNEINIKNGVLAFIDHRTKATQDVKNINLSLEADSLKGPFEAQGDLVYQEKKITLEAKTGKLPQGDEALKVTTTIGVPDAGTTLSFNGLATIKAPFDVQGQTNFKTGSLQKLGGMFGASLPSTYDKSISAEGVLSADQTKVDYNDLKFSFGDLKANGKFAVSNLADKNPLKIEGTLKSESVLDLNQFIGGKAKAVSSEAGTKSASVQKTLVPTSLTLPMAIDADVNLDVGGLKIQDHQVKGVFVDLNKTGKTTTVAFRALEAPGQAKADGTLNVSYASSSKSPQSGQIIMTDPTVSYKINGQIGQLASFLKAFAPQANTSAVTKLYKTAQFNLDGRVSGNTVSLKESTMKLGDMVIGLGGQYQPASNGGRAKATIDLSAGTVDFDKIKAATGGNASGNAGSNSSASKGSAKDALDPIRNLSVPMDVTFDVSMQKARINGADLDGLRVAGSLIGNTLTLSNASVNNYAGAAMSVKGKVANLQKLSGLDLSAYTKTSDVKRLMTAFKVDTSKLPSNLSALEANITGKGSLDNLAFTSNIKAMGGQLDAAGNAANPLDNLALSGLTVGLKHPNLNQAIKAVSPNFKGQAGLAQSIDFHAKAKSQGKTYTLTDMKTTLGSTNFAGDLTINAGANPVSVRGNIQAGKIALDQLLGAKSASGGGASSGASQSSGKWSTAPIDLSFMNTVDVNVGLSASNVTYGKWNFTNPSTDLKIGNGQMVVNGLKAGVFGGSATLNTTVKASPVSVALNSNMNKIDLEALASALSGSGKLKTSGAVDFSMDVNGAGGSANALINALNGRANLNGTDVTIKGFDLAKLARGLATEEKLITSALSVVNGAVSGGQTKFDTMKGDYKITNGVVNLTSMVMDSSDAVINSTGYADLPKWFINVDNTVTLKSVTDLEPFGVKIKGSLSNPKDTFGKKVLEDYVTAKLKRKLGKELEGKLPDLLGGDVTDKLQKFGILPQKQQAAPAPANDNAPAQQQAAPTPAPAAEPKKIEKPKDAIDTLLNSGGNPEKAVNDLLKGLF